MEGKRRVAIVINLDWTLKHHHEVFAGTQIFAGRHAWNCALWPFPPDVVDEVGRPLYDGIIGRVRPDLEEKANQAGIPLVNVWVSSPCKDVPAVYPDLWIAGTMAGEHLHARGFRRFGYVGMSRAASSQHLQKGLRDSAKKHGIKVDSLLVSSSFSESTRSWSAFQNDLRKWAARLTPPVGVLTINDKVARYVINAVAELGHAVPEDVAVIGMENEEVICRHPSPSITSIDLGNRRVGEMAAELLERLMDGEKPPSKAVELPPATLISRKSTDSFKVDDDVVADALKFIAEQSHRPIKVKDVVAHIPLSWRSLERRFHHCRGSTISKEITRFRIERAKRLLVETELLVKQVAESSGFANTRRLCEVFRRVEGTTPEKYRKQRSQNR